jgi:hypothetical protein
MKILILGMYILMTLQPSTQDWTYVGQSKDGAVKIYLRENSVKMENGFISCIVKTATSPSYQMDLRRARGRSVRGYETYSQSRLIYSIDCSKRKYMLRKRTDYNNVGAFLEDVSLTGAEAKWTDVVPNTVANTIFDRVCRMKF